MSQYVIPESLFPIILSFLVDSDPPEWMLPPDAHVDLTLFYDPYHRNQWIRGHVKMSWYDYLSTLFYYV